MTKSTLEPEFEGFPLPEQNHYEVPKYILALVGEGTITMSEGFFIAIVNGLLLAGEGCHNNDYLAERFGCKKRWIESTISRLTKLGLVSKAGYDAPPERYLDTPWYYAVRNRED